VRLNRKNDRPLRNPRNRMGQSRARSVRLRLSGYHLFSFRDCGRGMVAPVDGDRYGSKSGEAMNDLKLWKKQLEAAIQDYIQNPCITTADAMLRAALSWTGKNHLNQGGTVLAVVEEARRVGCRLTGPAFWAYRFAFGFGYLLTRKEQTWNEYWSLRWLLRQDPLAVEALHSRCHMKDEHGATLAGIHTNRLLVDRDFHFAFRRVIEDLGCQRCARIFFDPDGTDNRALLERGRSGDVA
jgi:hypothetical protein